MPGGCIEALARGFGTKTVLRPYRLSLGPIDLWGDSPRVKSSSESRDCSGGFGTEAEKVLCQDYRLKVLEPNKLPGNASKSFLKELLQGV